MSNDTVQALTDSIRQARELLVDATALDRLKANKDFKKLILEGYFRDEAVRLVHLKADSSVQTPDKQQSIINQIDAIGALSTYLSTVYFKARQAERSIAADEDTLQELAQEELSNG